MNECNKKFGKVIMISQDIWTDICIPLIPEIVLQGHETYSLIPDEI